MYVSTDNRYIFLQSIITVLCCLQQDVCPYMSYIICSDYMLSSITISLLTFITFIPTIATLILTNIVTNRSVPTIPLSLNNSTMYAHTHKQTWASIAI